MWRPSLSDAGNAVVAGVSVAAVANSPEVAFGMCVAGLRLGAVVRIFLLPEAGSVLGDAVLRPSLTDAGVTREVGVIVAIAAVTAGEAIDAGVVRVCFGVARADVTAGVVRMCFGAIVCGPPAVAGCRLGVVPIGN